MKFFADSVLKPFIKESGYRDICEIGASLGENTDQLLELPAVRIALIDPCIDAHLTGKYANEARVHIHRGISLEVLPRLSETFDCFLLDGDHNWYTVYHELKAIKDGNLLRPGGAIFFHDISWPYGRRDMYYDPSQIPLDFRQPLAKKGIVEGVSALSETGGANAHLYNARHEGGPRNGVLTAIEDFLKENRRQYAFFPLHMESGLGVMLKKGGGLSSRRAFSRHRFRARVYAFTEKFKDLLKPSRKRPATQ